jgi:hypothetical protein
MCLSGNEVWSCLTECRETRSSISPVAAVWGRRRQVNLGSLIEVEFDEPYAAVPAVGARKAGFGQIKPTERQTAKISLNDCLACSGCITSAETVLIQQQSLAEFYTALTDASRIHVVTVSPQTRAALAARFNLSILQVYV